MKSDCDSCLHNRWSKEDIKVLAKPVCYHPKGSWFQKAEICWCRVQNLWMLEHSDILYDGIWPLKESGYIDTHENVQTSTPLTPAHQTTIEVWAELVKRLDRTGEDGETLRSEAAAGMDIYQLSRAAKNALNYCSGWRRRLTPYAVWKAKRRYKSIPLK
jgi:hypothetical protein